MSILLFVLQLESKNFKFHLIITIVAWIGDQYSNCCSTNVHLIQVRSENKRSCTNKASQIEVQVSTVSRQYGAKQFVLPTEQDAGAGFRIPRIAFTWTSDDYRLADM